MGNEAFMKLLVPSSAKLDQLNVSPRYLLICRLNAGTRHGC